MTREFFSCEALKLKYLGALDSLGVPYVLDVLVCKIVVGNTKILISLVWLAVEGDDLLLHI